jgi:hypothetical protein
MATSKYESRKVVSNCTKIWLCLSKKIREFFYHLAIFFQKLSPGQASSLDIKGFF